MQNPFPNGSCVGSERQSEGFGQLVGARSALAAAVDAFQPGYRVGGFHAAHECRYALRVAVAAARERHIADDAVFSLNDYINLADQKMYASKKARKAAREEAKN